jgi:hypothetical protein
MATMNMAFKCKSNHASYAVAIHHPRTFSGEVHIIKGIVTSAWTIILMHFITDLISSLPTVVVRLKRSDAMISPVSSNVTLSLANLSAVTLP